MALAHLFKPFEQLESSYDGVEGTGNANSMNKAIKRGLAAGFNNYLSKPVDIQKLFGILDSYLPRQTGTAHE